MANWVIRCKIKTNPAFHAITKIEDRATPNPAIETVKKIADEIGMPLDDLIKYE